MIKIVVLGTGCPKCRTLEKSVRDTVANMGIESEITKEEDIMKIMEYGILHTPGLVINGRVVASGRIPTAKEITSFIEAVK
jgi:small redox-active disulfide protein 2